jgi:chromosome segregation ATPase
MSASNQTHEFGNNVDDVRRKLEDNLPLVDAGVERAKELHEIFASELSEYDSNYGELEESLEKMQSEATELASRVTEVQSQVTSTVEGFVSSFEEIEQLTNTSIDQLTAAQQRVESELESVGSQVQSAASSLESQFGSLSTQASSMQEMLENVKQQAESKFAELADSVESIASQWQADESSSGEALDSLQSKLADSHTAEMKEKFDGFNQKSADTVSGMVSLLTEHEGGIGEFFSAFDADAESLADGFKEQAQEIFGNLKEFAESEVGGILEETLENLTKETVEAFAAEIASSIAMTQVGVATTGALSPIIPQLVIAKKVTGVMNAIL